VLDVPDITAACNEFKKRDVVAFFSGVISWWIEILTGNFVTANS